MPFEVGDLRRLGCRDRLRLGDLGLSCGDRCLLVGRRSRGVRSFGFLGGALGFVIGAPALTDGEPAGDQGDDERRGDSGNESAEPADPSLFDDELALVRSRLASRNDRSRLARRHWLVIDPALELLQAPARHQQIRRSTGGVPFGGGRFQASLDEQRLATLGDPSPVPRPLAQQCLVGDLDRLASADRIAIEGDQPERSECRDDLVDDAIGEPEVSSSLRPARRRVSPA